MRSPACLGKADAGGFDYAPHSAVWADKELAHGDHHRVWCGIVISLLGKWWLGPDGRDDFGVVTTLVCGVAGVLVGWYAAADHSEFAATLTGRSLAGRL